ncbi:MAG: acetamidase/formamidase family protein [Bilifractor sp.]|jgi:amidase
MKVVELDQSTPYFDKDLEPVCRINPGETIQMNSPDCWADKLTDENVLKTDLLASGLEMNPCAGPVYVNGAMPGDTLKIFVEDIEIPSHKGRLALISREFVAGLGRYLEKEDETVVVNIDDEGYADFFGKFKIKTNPMLGVLAVTPDTERVGTMWPGNFGGNLDCKLLTKGTTLYLPVQVPGALMIAGDCHGLQSDGEILASLEAQSRITLKVDVIKNRSEEWPVLETKDKWYLLSYAKTIDEANGIVLNAMANFLIKRGKYSSSEWLAMMGVAGDLEICEIVDPLVGSRFGMPKSITGDLRF